MARQDALVWLKYVLFRAVRVGTCEAGARSRRQSGGHRLEPKDIQNLVEGHEIPPWL